MAFRQTEEHSLRCTVRTLNLDPRRLESELQTAVEDRALVSNFSFSFPLDGPHLSGSAWQPSPISKAQLRKRSVNAPFPMLCKDIREKGQPRGNSQHADSKMRKVMDNSNHSHLNFELEPRFSICGLLTRTADRKGMPLKRRQARHPEVDKLAGRKGERFSHLHDHRRNFFLKVRSNKTVSSQNRHNTVETHSIKKRNSKTNSIQR